MGAIVRRRGERDLHRCQGRIRPVPHDLGRPARYRVIGHATRRCPTCRSGPTTSSACTSAGRCRCGSSYNRRSTYWADWPEPRTSRATASRFVLLRGTRSPAPRLDFSTSYKVTRQLHVLLRLDQHPQEAVQVGHRPHRSVRRSVRPGRDVEVFPMVVALSRRRSCRGGVRFRFGGDEPAPRLRHRRPRSAAAAAASRRAGRQPRHRRRHRRHRRRSGERGLGSREISAQAGGLAPRPRRLREPRARAGCAA